MAEISAVTDASFATDVLGADRPVVVDVWATWCQPCRIIAKTLNELVETDLADKVIFTKLDADVNPQTVQSYDVRGLPTLLLFSGGELIDSLTGAYPKKAVINFLESALARV